jgi:hypothetical protein
MLPYFMEPFCLHLPGIGRKSSWNKIIIPAKNGAKLGLIAKSQREK